MKRVIGGGLDNTGFVHYALTNRKSLIILGALLMLPGCFSRSLARLSWPSFLTVCAITVAVVFVLISFFHHSKCFNCDSYRTVLHPRPLWWAVQGVVCFCFTFQRVIIYSNVFLK
jgi:amino acid permease